MSRVKKASGWWAVVLAGGVLLGLPAGAAAKKDPVDCKGGCQQKANAAVSTCAQPCGKAKAAGKQEEALQCMNRCSEKYQSTLTSCEKTCPAEKKAPEQIH